MKKKKSKKEILKGKTLSTNLLSICLLYLSFPPWEIGDEPRKNKKIPIFKETKKTINKERKKREKKIAHLL